MSPGAENFHDLLVKAVSQAREGITIADAQQPDFPLIFVNEGFERLTGYSSGEVIAKNYRLLQGTDTDQPEIDVMLAAMANGEGCDVTLRNYRKDGSMFWGRLRISPMHDAQGTLTHFFGILKDLADKGRAEQQQEAAAYIDPLVGISNRRHFDERFADLLHVAQRIHSGISLLLIDMDHFKLFNERYGRAAGDECLRMVGGCITKSFMRTSDCIARYGGAEFAIVSFSTDIEALRHHAQRLCEQVRALSIPHGGSPHGVVTISIGGIHRLPNRDTTEELLIGLAGQELLAAKRSGRDRVHITG
ncbi:MAG TPA: diguanylate cyclase [Gallionella sp.]|nr:diguanylate cyclase [Gallionella sp.]